MSAPSLSYYMLGQQTGVSARRRIGTSARRHVSMSARRHMNGTVHMKNKLTLNHAGLAGVPTCGTYIP